VTVTGTHLGSGTDIVEAKIAGQAAAIIQQQSATTVVFIVPSAAHGVSLDVAQTVELSSSSRGRTVLVGGFTYNPGTEFECTVPRFAWLTRDLRLQSGL
jgi:hypothetical protein